MTTTEEPTAGIRPGRRRAVPSGSDRRRVWFIAGAAALVTLIVVLWVLWAPWSGSDPAPPKSPAPARSAASVATYGAEWTAVGGHRYRITVTPAGRTTTEAAVGGCVTAALAGQANVRFGVRIDNLTAKKAPVPAIEFGGNVGALGQVRPATMTLDRSSRRIELSPRAEGQTCARAVALGPDGRTQLARYGAVTVLGTLGGINSGRTGTAPGLALIVRYHQADAASPSGSTAQEFIVPFSLR